MKVIRSRLWRVILVALLLGAVVVGSGGDAVAASTVTVSGTVVNPGWTPPGVASVTLCAAYYPCQTKSTNWWGGFSFSGAPAYRSIYLRVQTGIATCDNYNYYTTASGSQNLGVVYCWNN